MIIKADQCKTVVNVNMKGGDGAVQITHFVSAAELNEKGRLFGNIHLEPGASIGYHVHEGESELFYVHRGEAVYNDNGTEYPLGVGDIAIVKAGDGHCVANKGTEPVDLIALIVYA